MTWLLVFLTISLLILLTALYVSAEFSTVSARRPRLAQMAEDGYRLARRLLPIVQNPRQLDTYIAACQVGITLTSLLLGFFGQAWLTPAIAPLLSSLGNFSQAAAYSLSASGVLIALTALQMVLGELVPKSIGIQYPERMALSTVLPMRWSMMLFKPLIWLFNGSGRLLLKLSGQAARGEHAHLHGPQEIMMLFEESSAGGQLDREERRLLRKSLQLRELAVRQVMIPRNRMLVAEVNRPLEELKALLADSPFSRLPLYEGSVDNVVGIVHLKDLVCLRPQTGLQEVRQAMRPVQFVPEAMPVDEVLALLQRQHYHVAIVLDEYGGTAGIVTLEDLIEEIFGELKDEFDAETAPPIRIVSDRKVQARGDMLVSEVNELLGLFLPSEDVDTIGGLVLNELGHVPGLDEKVELQNVTLSVDGIDGKAVTAVGIEVTPEQVARLREYIQ